MGDRRDLSEIWDEDGSDSGDEEEEEEPTDDGKRNKVLDNFDRMQKAGIETIENFSAPPAQPRAGPVRGPPPPKGPTISLDAHYREVYNRDMNDRYGDWMDSEDYSTPSSQEEEEEDSGEGDESVESEEEETVSPSDSSTGPKKRKRAGKAVERPRQKRPRVAYDTEDRPECFLCSWGNVYHDGIEAPHINKLTAIIKENYGVHHNREIARELHLYFKNEIYRPGTGMTMLTTAVALEHIEQLHTQDARIFLGESIKQEKKLLFCFMNRIYREDGTWDTDALKEYRNSKKELRTLYTMPLNRMNFNNGNTAEDMRRAANYHNLMPKFDRRPAKKKPTTAFRI
jgi:hypothetical protein